jgi:hypothetical protein
VIRNVALLLALALACPALAQTAPTPKPSPAKPSPAKPSPAKPSPAKPVAKIPAPPQPAPSKPDAAAAAAAAQHGPCIGVIPRIGDVFAVKKIGLTIFNNEYSEVPIEPWGLDDLVVARVRAAAGPRFAVRRIAYASDAFETFDHPEKRVPKYFDEGLKTIMETVTRSDQCERYFLVLKGAAEFGGTNQVIKGIGIVNRGFAALNTTFLHALSSIMVIDGRSYETLKTGVGRQDYPVGSSIFGVLRGPGYELKDFSWPPAPDAITGLRDRTRALLAESLDKVLPELLAPAPKAAPPYIPSNIAN